MLEGAFRRTDWSLGLVAVVGALTAAGCEADRVGPIAANRVVTPAAEVEQAMGPLSVAPDANPAPETAQAQA